MTVPFVGGDDLIQEFLIEDSDGEILDLSGVTVTGIIKWQRRVRIELDVTAGINIETEAPARTDDQAPHGIIRLTEDQTITFPLGAIAGWTMTVVDNGVTMTTYAEILRRIGSDEAIEPSSLAVLRLVNGRRVSAIDASLLTVDGQILTISAEGLSVG